jgi:hypothetical protein
VSGTHRVPAWVFATHGYSRVRQIRRTHATAAAAAALGLAYAVPLRHGESERRIVVAVLSIAINSTATTRLLLLLFRLPLMPMLMLTPKPPNRTALERVVMSHGRTFHAAISVAHSIGFAFVLID